MAMSGGDVQSPLYTLSIKELQRAARLPAASPLAEEALLLEASRNPTLETQPWWDSIRHKLQTRSLIADSYRGLHNLATTRLEGNTGIDAQQLAECYAIVIRRNPTRETMQADYAELLGGALSQPSMAIEHWRLALPLDPDPSTYGPRLAAYLVSRHRHEEAIAVIAKTMELRPSLQGNRELQALLAKARASDAASGTESVDPISTP
jgi:hypothetical protein